MPGAGRSPGLGRSQTLGGWTSVTLLSGKVVTLSSTYLRLCPEIRSLAVPWDGPPRGAVGSYGYKEWGAALQGLLALVSSLNKAVSSATPFRATLTKCKCATNNQKPQMKGLVCTGWGDPERWGIVIQMY